ncbi:MAG: hypothetical protein H0T73_19590 [Ardenticatenales bacterium]|nr:hypothetical protein [Ardenticatenales bacterium]
MALRTATGTKVEIVAVIQRYDNGDAKVSIRLVGRAHFEIVMASRLQADGGPEELWAAVAQAEQGA